MKREKIAILPKLFDYSGDISKKWYVYFSVRDPRNGKMQVKKIYKGLFIHKNKAKRYEAAKTLIDKYTELIRSGYNFMTDETENLYTDSLEYGNAAKIYSEKKKANRSFNYYASEFMQNNVSGLEPATVHTYKSKLRIFDLWLRREHMTESDITALDNETLIKFFTFLNTERKSSMSTYKKYKNILHAVFETVLDKKVIAFNPVQRLPKCYHVVDAAPKPIHPDVLPQIIVRLKETPALYLFAMFEYYCFMRPGKEIRLMKVGWIDFSAGTIKVPKTITKTKKEKIPIIPDDFLRIIMEDYKLQKWPKDYFVFGKYGEPGMKCLGKNTMSARFRKIRDELNLPSDYMLYSFKHTGNSMLRRSGASSYERMMQNGHSNIATTEGYTKEKFGFDSEHIRKNFPPMTKKA